MTDIPPPWEEWREDDLKDASMEELLEARDRLERFGRALAFLDWCIKGRCN